MKTLWKFLKKLEVKLLNDPAIPLLDVYLKRKKHEFKKKTLHPSVHSSTVYNNQNIEATEVSINR